MQDYKYKLISTTEIDCSNSNLNVNNINAEDTKCIFPRKILTDISIPTRIYDEILLIFENPTRRPCKYILNKHASIFNNLHIFKPKYYYIHRNVIIFKFELRCDLLIHTKVLKEYYIENMKNRNVPQKVINELQHII